MFVYRRVFFWGGVDDSSFGVNAAKSNGLLEGREGKSECSVTIDEGNFENVCVNLTASETSTWYEYDKSRVRAVGRDFFRDVCGISRIDWIKNEKESMLW